MRARIRTIKPEAHTDEKLWDAEQETGLPLFRAFTGLWTHSDREGRFEWRPRPLKAGILPYWEGDFSRVLDALVTRGFVCRYTSGGREFGCVVNFLKHQVINNREEESRIPAHDEEGSTYQEVPRVDDACLTREGRVPHATLPCTRGREGKGREGKGTEGNDASPSREPPKSPRRKPSKAIPSDWAPTARHIEHATQRGIDAAATGEKFRAHAEANDRRCVDWDRAFDNWLMNERPTMQKKAGFDPFARVRMLKEAGR